MKTLVYFALEFILFVPVVLFALGGQLVHLFLFVAYTSILCGFPAWFWRNIRKANERVSKILLGA